MLSVVTKTGTNDFAGSAYGFFRDDSLASKTETEKQAGIDKQPYERQQYGASLGGPIVSDRAHFFATYEKHRPRDLLHRQHRRRLPELRRHLGPAAVRGRADHRQGDLDISASSSSRCATASRRTATSTAPRRRRAVDTSARWRTSTRSILAGHTAQFGSDKLNEFVFQYTKFDNSISADSNDALVTFPSGFATGQNVNTPQTTSQTQVPVPGRLQLLDARSPAGATTSRSASTTSTSRLWAATSRPAPPGSSSLIEDRPGSPISDIFINGGFFGDATPVDQYSVYVQDDWRGQRPADGQPRPALRLLGRASTSTSGRTRSGRRCRPRPATTRATCGTSRAAAAACSRTTTTTSGRASASPTT